MAAEALSAALASVGIEEAVIVQTHLRRLLAASGPLQPVAGRPLDETAAHHTPA
jgi:hypothetical protein